MKEWRKRLAEGALEGVVIAAIAFGVVCLFHFLFEPHHLQEDEVARTNQALSERNGARTASLVCTGDLRGANDKVGLLSNQVTAQQTQISGQQTLISGQQANSSKQQSTFDLCVTTLVKANEPLRPSITMLKLGDEISNPKTKHTLRIVLITNTPVTPVKLPLFCDGTIKEANVRPLGDRPYSGGMLAIKSRSPILAPRVWQINMSFPVWSPAQPLLVQLDYDDNLGNCTIGG